MTAKDVVWITGGAQGIGLGLALGLAERGWAVAINDIDEAKLRSAAAELAKRGPSLAIVSDISVKADVERTVREIKEKLGPVKALVNNAFWVTRGTILDTTEADWRRIIDVGLTGYFFCAQAAAKEMVAQRDGRIVNLSAGIAERAIPSTLAYAASKGGVNTLTRSIAVELAQYGVRANTVTIGPVMTEAFHTMANDPTQVASRINRVPLGRLGTPEDLLGLVALLLADESSWITGGLFHVDGGANNAALTVRVAP